jgi:ankyrin repeat protein
MPLYLLAKNDHTSPAIKQLLASGEQIDQRDNKNETALAYALQHDDLGAAKRLLKLHARPDVLIGYENIPLALMPVMQENLEAVRLMREFGVDYSKIRFQGATAIDFAKQSGNRALLQALGRNDTEL